MNVAAILKLKGRTVVTTTVDRPMLDVAKLLAQHGIGCIVIYTVTYYKPDNSPRLLARKFSSKDDSSAPMTQGSSRSSLGTCEREGSGVGVGRMTEQPNLKGAKEWSKQELSLFRTGSSTGVRSPTLPPS